MIPFKDIELQDKELTSLYFKRSRRNCDLSFSNLWIGVSYNNNTKFAIMDGFLLLKFWADGSFAIYDAYRQRRFKQRYWMR